MGLSDIGERMSVAEAARVALLLLSDPSSQTAAAAAGWDYPITWETMALLDLYDLEHAKANPKAKPHTGRPWMREPEPEAVRHGDADGRTPEQVKAILRSQFGQPEPPPA